MNSLVILDEERWHYDVSGESVATDLYIVYGVLHTSQSNFIAAFVCFFPIPNAFYFKPSCRCYPLNISCPLQPPGKRNEAIISIFMA